MTTLSSNCPPRPLHPTFIVLRYINMDDAKTNSPEIQTTEVVAPKPPVIITIEACQLAHTQWNEAEGKRQKMLALAQKASLSTAEYAQPAPKSDEVIKSEQLSALTLKTKSICDNAFGEGGQPEAFDALITDLTDGTPATPKRVIQAGTLIENTSYSRRNPNKAGLILEKYPEALYLPGTQNALHQVASELARSVESLRTAATTKPEDPQDSSKLLEVATSETSPLEKNSKDQLRDTLDLVRGAKAQRFVDGLIDPSINEPKAALLKDNHLVLISEITGVALDKSSLEDALSQHKKLLTDRGIATSNYAQLLSRINFGEALAALSQRTEDPAQKRHLEALALGYAAAIERDPDYPQSEKANNVLMALVLDTKNPEVSAYDTVHEGVKRSDNILAKLIPMVSDHTSNYRDSDIFSRQNEAAVHAKNARLAVEEARAAAEKAKADELTAQAKAEADRLAAKAKTATPIIVASTTITSAKNRSVWDKIRGR